MNEWQNIAELGMGMMSLVALILIAFKLLSVVEGSLRELQGIKLELQQCVALIRTYIAGMSHQSYPRPNNHKTKKEDPWTEKP